MLLSFFLGLLVVLNLYCNVHFSICTWNLHTTNDVLLLLLLLFLALALEENPSCVDLPQVDLLNFILFFMLDRKAG